MSLYQLLNENNCEYGLEKIGRNTNWRSALIYLSVYCTV